MPKCWILILISMIITASGSSVAKQNHYFSSFSLYKELKFVRPQGQMLYHVALQFYYNNLFIELSFDRSALFYIYLADIC